MNLKIIRNAKTGAGGKPVPLWKMLPTSTQGSCKETPFASRAATSGQGDIYTKGCELVIYLMIGCTTTVGCKSVIIVMERVLSYFVSLEAPQLSDKPDSGQIRP
jgi:hypothetical protein